MTVVMSR